MTTKSSHKFCIPDLAVKHNYRVFTFYVTYSDSFGLLGRVLEVWYPELAMEQAGSLKERFKDEMLLRLCSIGDYLDFPGSALGP